MILLDQKLANNRAALEAAENEKKFYEESFRVQFGETLDTDQRDALREHFSRIDAEANERLQTIEAREWGQNITISSPNAPATLAYGYCRLGGVRTFHAVDQGTTGEFLHQYITLAGHRVRGIHALYLDGQEVDFNDVVDGQGRRTFGWSVGDKWGLPLIGKVFLSAITRGETSQTANADLLSQASILFPTLWTSDHIQTGYAGAYLIFYYDAEIFISGPPEISFEGYWKDDIYDPRTEQRGWTNNAALVYADYMTSAYGPDYTYDDFNLANLREAADICDEEVTLAAGGTEKRYTINAHFPISTSYGHDAIKRDMEAAFGGKSVEHSGQWYIYPGKWRAPVKALDPSHFRSALKIQIKPGQDQIFSGVKGVFRSPEAGWEPTDYPPITNSFYAEEDGRESLDELDLTLVSSTAQAQRLAKMQLEKSRQWITVAGEFGAECLVLTPCDNITITYDKLGWDEKPFEVISVDGQISGPKITVGLLLKETAEAVFDWSEEETTFDLAPNTTLPNPAFVRIPSGLTLLSGTDQLDIRTDGTVFSRIKATWNATTDIFVEAGGFHEIEYKKSTDSAWTPAGIFGGRSTFAYILDLQDGTDYDVRLRATTQFGASDWLTVLNHFVAGKTEAPSTPATFTNEVLNTGILFKWSAITDKDLAEYQILLGATLETSVLVVATRATNFLYRGLVSGSYKFWLRALDTTSNFSNPRTLDITINAPGQTGTIDALGIFQMVRLAWPAAPAGTFPVESYKVFKGADFGTAVQVGQVTATIITLQEATGGDYTYWVQPVDIYGNVGTANSVQVNLKGFSFFELITDIVLDPSTATLDNAVAEPGQLLAPVNITETWDEHFTDRSWTDFDDQGTAGYPLWYQPTETAGEIEIEYDYGSTIGAAQVVFLTAGAWVDGSGTVDIFTATSPDGSTWSETAGNTKLGETFRYVRLRIEITGDDDTSLYVLPSPRLLLEVVTEDDTGSVSAASSDGSGTLIAFNKDFLDVFEDAINLTYKGSSAYFPSYTISGNDVRVFLWDTSGTRVSGPVTWRVTGVVAR